MTPAGRICAMLLGTLPLTARAGTVPPGFDFPGALFLVGMTGAAVLLAAARLVALLRRAPGTGDGR